MSCHYFEFSTGLLTTEEATQGDTIPDSESPIPISYARSNTCQFPRFRFPIMTESVIEMPRKNPRFLLLAQSQSFGHCCYQSCIPITLIRAQVFDSPRSTLFLTL